MTIKVHEETDFEPQRRGRPRKVNIDELIKSASDNEGKWVEEEYSNKDAQSVVRQLRQYEGLEFATNKGSVDGARKVFVKVG